MLTSQSYSMRIAQAVFDACKRQVEKNRSLDGVNLASIVYQVREIENVASAPGSEHQDKII